MPEGRSHHPPTIAVVGSGAAGLFAAIWAGRRLRELGLPGRVLAIDGAKKLGAKILVAGGGRCNVTHYAVDETAYAGSSPNAIKKVLRSFDVAQTVKFFGEMGVELKREETGKLFPVSDDGQSVLNALMAAADRAKVELVHPWRVDRIERVGERFSIVRALSVEGTEPVDRSRDESRIEADVVILATGGRALPRTGSDGHGHGIARSFGHTITKDVIPALVPLTLDTSRTFIPSLSGLTLPTTVEVVSSTGKRLASFTNSTLLAHFGVSGPSVLDVSRYYTLAKRADAGAKLVMNFLPGVSFDALDAMLGDNPKTTVLRRLATELPERLSRAIIEDAGIEPSTPIAQLKRDDRRRLAHAVTGYVLPVTGDRGYTYAEVTAGGVPLSEIKLDVMASRTTPGLFLCGEICDVDGRIGGFNFQWAWASGYLAGRGAVAALQTAAQSRAETGYLPSESAEIRGEGTF